MSKQDFIKSLKIKAGDEHYFVRLYGLIAVELHAYKEFHNKLPSDLEYWKERRGERRGFEMCLRLLGRYTDRQIDEIHDKIIDHINLSK